MPRIAFHQLDLVPIPGDIPELGIEAGQYGTVDTVYAIEGEAGRGLYVEVSRDDGTTVGFVQLEAKPGSDDWRVMAYSAFD